MAEREEIATVIGNLRGKIDVLKRTLGPDSDLARLISHAETDLDGLAARYTAASTGEDLTPIRTALDDLDKVLSRILAVQTPRQTPRNPSWSGDSPSWGKAGRALASSYSPSSSSLLLSPSAKWAPQLGKRFQADVPSSCWR